MSEEAQTFGNLPQNDASTEREYISEEAVLEDLRSEVEEAVSDETLWLRVPERPGIEFGFSQFIDYDDLQSWIRSCTRGKKFDGKRLAALVLLNNTRGIRSKGRDVTKDSDALTLRSEYWWRDMLKQRDSQWGLKHIYGKEGHILAAGQEVMEKAGYGDVDLECENVPSLAG